MINSGRVTTVVACVAIVLVALLLRDPADPDDGTVTTLASPPPASAPPSEVPRERFCEAFEAMAAAHANHLANNTADSLAEVTAAGKAVLDLAPGSPMPPPAREGLEHFVAGVLGSEAEPVTEASTNAFSSFIEIACRPGAS